MKPDLRGSVSRRSSIGAYLGLVPTEYSSRNFQVQGSITKAGNAHVRRGHRPTASICQSSTRAGGHLTTCPDWPGLARSEYRRLQPSVRRRCTGKPLPRRRNGIPIRHGCGSRNQRGCRSKRFRENRLSSVYPLVDVRRQCTIPRRGHQPRLGPAGELTARRLVAVWSRAGVWAGRPAWAGWWAPSPDPQFAYRRGSVDFANVGFRVRRRRQRDTNDAAQSADARSVWPMGSESMTLSRRRRHRG